MQEYRRLLKTFEEETNNMNEYKKRYFGYKEMKYCDRQLNAPTIVVDACVLYFVV